MGSTNMSIHTRIALRNLNKIYHNMEDCETLEDWDLNEGQMDIENCDLDKQRFTEAANASIDSDLNKGQMDIENGDLDKQLVAEPANASIDEEKDFVVLHMPEESKPFEPYEEKQKKKREFKRKRSNMCLAIRIIGFLLFVVIIWGFGRASR